MIASSPLAKLMAASGAVALHGAVIWGLSGDAPVNIEGAAGAPEVSIGTSFADMAAGVVSPDAITEAVEPAPAAEVIEAVMRPELVTPSAPLKATKPKVHSAAMVRPGTAQPEQAEPAPRQSSDTLDALPVLPQLSPTLPVDEAKPLEAPTTAVARSLRPKLRSKSFEEAHRPSPTQPEQKTKPKSQAKPKPAPAGNAKQTAKAGATSGSQTATTKTVSAGKTTAKQSGNAAVSNYPGKVMKKISRVRKPRVGQKGTAVVSFSIAPGGGLASVGLARSSGSGALDQAAIGVIRKAAPFPPPPKGAQRSFTIKIKGR